MTKGPIKKKYGGVLILTSRPSSEAIRTYEVLVEEHL